MSKKDMLGVAVRKLVALPESHLGVACDFLEKVADPVWIEASKKFLRKEPPWEAAKKKDKKPLILIPRPFDPVEFIGKRFSVWKGPADGNGLEGEEDIDPRSLELAKIDITKILFETCLKEDEERITGEEKLRRLKAKPDFIRHGGNVFLALWLDYQRNKEDSILERLYKERGIRSLDFMGLILRNPDGDRFVLCLSRHDDDEWYWNYFWLGDDWDGGDFSACSAS